MKLTAWIDGGQSLVEASVFFWCKKASSGANTGLFGVAAGEGYTMYKIHRGKRIRNTTITVIVILVIIDLIVLCSHR